MARWPDNVTRVVIGGTLPREDTWSMSWYIADEGTDHWTGNPPWDGVRAAMMAPIVNWFGSSLSGISNVAKLNWIKCNMIASNGHYKHPYTNEWLVNGTTGVVGGTNVPAWQHVSVALSHRANEARGPATRGRVFPPAVIAAPNAAGVIPPQIVQNMADAWARTLRAVAEAIPGDIAGTPLIVSSGTRYAPDTPTRRPISYVEVGDVMDIQNRRRNARREMYYRSEEPVSPGAATGTQPL